MSPVERPRQVLRHQTLVWHSPDGRFLDTLEHLWICWNHFPSCHRAAFQKLLESPEFPLKRSSNDGALVFPETMSIMLFLHFENKKDSKSMCSTLPDKLGPPETEEGQDNSFWNRGAKNREMKRRVGCC